jgi:acyl-CoA hydrolase
MSQEELFQEPETRQCKMVFPGTLNANGTLFGGEVMKWMDEVAFYSSEQHFAPKAVFVMTALNENNKVTRLYIPQLLNSIE